MKIQRENVMIWSWNILIFFFEFFSENQENPVPTSSIQVCHYMKISMTRTRKLF
jgi:hypothetical protein